MNNEWRTFAWRVAAWVFVALLVQAATTMFLGGPVPYLVPGLLGLGALQVGVLDRTVLPHGPMLKRGVALLMIVFAAWFALPERASNGIPWQPFSDDILQAARKGGRPVMIEFTIENCGPCTDMQRNVFPRSRVVEAAEPFIALKADLTNADTNTLALSERFNIEAFPTFVFIGSDGQERVNLRLVGYEPAEFFAARLQSAR